MDDFGEQARHSPPIFEETLTIASRGHTMWAAKDHNKKWVRKLSGTPIVNDLLVCIAKEFQVALREARREALEEAASAATGAMSDDYCEECKGNGEINMLRAIRALVAEEQGDG